tara:strand:- start:2760 stop:3008 length:249 start_codon:yes stop_codon:yes gene_type:complete
MDILNPRIAIRKSGWLGKLFIGEYIIEFTYAKEYYTTTRWRCEEVIRKYGAATHSDAMKVVSNIKSKVSYGDVFVYDETVED